MSNIFGSCNLNVLGLPVLQYKGLYEGGLTCISGSLPYLHLLDYFLIKISVKCYAVVVIGHTAVSTKVVPQKRKSICNNANWCYG